ncbi:hypothetical protein [Lutispora thermophila]|uniref:hypothetical protein n=1 Tax=Lutispora thermophila TaxID=288966 RepID=UPI00093385B4|nr:hypothetical protein [Lutispora thermophila]
MINENAAYYHTREASRCKGCYRDGFLLEPAISTCVAKRKIFFIVPCADPKLEALILLEYNLLIDKIL